MVKHQNPTVIRHLQVQSDDSQGTHPLPRQYLKATAKEGIWFLRDVGPLVWRSTRT